MFDLLRINVLSFCSFKYEFCRTGDPDPGAKSDTKLTPGDLTIKIKSKSMIKILIYWLRKVYASSKKHLITPVITELYRQYATDLFKIKTEIVKVKKGKRKYTIVFYSLPNGYIKFILSRHQHRLDAML